MSTKSIFINSWYPWWPGAVDIASASDTNFFWKRVVRHYKNSNFIEFLEIDQNIVLGWELKDREIESSQGIGWYFLAKRKTKFCGFHVHTHVLRIFSEAKSVQEPILRLLNLQLLRQRCSRLQRFSKKKKMFFVSKRARLPGRCKNLQRWHCNSRS
jgi:hypothetical protein